MLHVTSQPDIFRLDARPVLTCRDANVPSYPTTKMTSNRDKRPIRHQNIAQRAQQNPLLDKGRAFEMREMRRKQYLGKVRQASDEQHWTRRSEQVKIHLLMRLSSYADCTIDSTPGIHRSETFMAAGESRRCSRKSACFIGPEFR